MGKIRITHEEGRKLDLNVREKFSIERIRCSWILKKQDSM